MAFERNDILVECITFMIRVTRIGEIETALAGTSN
jgi:hypothetical protein